MTSAELPADPAEPMPGRPMVDPAHPMPHQQTTDPSDSGPPMNPAEPRPARDPAGPRATVDPGETRSTADPAHRTQRRPATEAEAQALASSLRLRILRLCLDDELTNKEIAERLGRNPASVLHHVRRLVDTGFLIALPVRRGTRGSREVPYRATGKSWQVSGRDEPDRQRSSEVMLQAFLEELADAGGAIDDASRLGLRLNAEHRAEFSERIGAVLDEFAARPPDPDGERWSVFFALHPDRRGRHGAADPPADTSN